MSANITAVVDPITPKDAVRESVTRKLLRDPQALIAGSILLVIVVLGVGSPWFASHDPNAASLDAVNAPVGTPGYLLGGDQSGRDILSRLLLSIPTSLFTAVIGVSVAVIIGVTFGLIGGYSRKTVQTSTEWVFSLIQTFPGLLLLIVLVPLTGGDYRITMAIFGVLLAPGLYRIVRNQVLSVKNELYVDAARVSGVPDSRILGRHILFVVRSPIIIAAAFLAGACIGIQAGLAFLGLGSTLVPSFGAMISDAFANFYTDPLQLVWPSALLGLLTASLVLLGNSLRDALEGARPKSGSASSRGTTRQAPQNTAPSVALLDVRDLAIAYPGPDGKPREVVSYVSFTVGAGETVGLVGESGSGKTQTAFSVLGVLPREAIVTRGSIQLGGLELLDLSEKDKRAVRGRRIAYIPQEPMSNLDPSFTIGQQLVEGIRCAVPGLSRREARATMMGLLERVGITDPDRVFSSYPHQISGGMAQRVLIAGAVATRPEVLIADEPTTALDVTVQAEILDLIRELQAEMGMAVLLVTHNFGVVADICSRIVVMQSGRVVEEGDVRDVFASPTDPYTQDLLSSILDEGTVRLDPPRTPEPVEAQK